ncbi:DNA damage-repair/toleration protein DRT102-like [Vicia villosa]|uniref:DNA damage-repair/toleration protein DRT102-like n=1 Tax=Vicia villosa TaxID=3911 RepID=UPI00273B5FE0|nr:DNA damage-repair/toleration protein DRT102-like [Vicia villosa]
MALSTKHIKILVADIFGTPLKDALLPHLRALNIEFEDLGLFSSYDIAGAEVGRLVSLSASYTSPQIIGLVACGTSVGVSIFANKLTNVYAATCLHPWEVVNARSINNANFLALSGIFTSPKTRVEIIHAWLNAEFKAPCLASGHKPCQKRWKKLLDRSLIDMPKIGKGGACLAKKIV